MDPYGYPLPLTPTPLQTFFPMMPDGPVTTGASARGGPARSHLWYRFGTILYFSFWGIFFKTTPKKLGKDNFFTHNFEAACLFLDWIEI